MPSDTTHTTRSVSPPLGQSVWVDFLSRESIRGGHLQQLIDDYSVVGATSNPTIFQKAMGSGDAYDEQLHELAAAGRRRADASGRWPSRTSATPATCSVRSGSGGGPRRLRLAGGRSAAGLRHAGAPPRGDAPAQGGRSAEPDGQDPRDEAGARGDRGRDRQGPSINVTLIFSLRRYAEVAESYMRGLERLVAEGGDPRKVASVASFFVSRIDTEADRRLEELDGHDELRASSRSPTRARLPALPARSSPGRAGSTWRQGRHAAALLWASTSTKNPAYPDTLYVEELIGPDTVNTMPEETIKAYQDHGEPARALQSELDEAQRCSATGARRRRLRRRHRDARARGSRKIRGVLRAADRGAARQAAVARAGLIGARAGAAAAQG